MHLACSCHGRIRSHCLEFVQVPQVVHPNQKMQQRNNCNLRRSNAAPSGKGGFGDSSHLKSISSWPCVKSGTQTCSPRLLKQNVSGMQLGRVGLAFYGEKLDSSVRMERLIGEREERNNLLRSLQVVILVLGYFWFSMAHIVLLLFMLLYLNLFVFQHDLTSANLWPPLLMHIYSTCLVYLKT